MRLSKLDLLAFGHFRGLSLDFSKPGLHVVMGRNEAGKSTTLRAITGLLYGIDPRTSDAHIHKPADLRIGGVLESMSGDRVRVVRRKGNTNTLLDEKGQAIDDSVIKKLLAGVTEETFRNAFGLDHDTLERGAKALLEGRGDLGESLFDASVGGGGEVQRLLAELNNEAEKIYKPRATSLPLNEALRDLDVAQKLVRERQSLPEAFIEQEKGLEAAIRERAERNTRLTELKGRRARLDRAKRRVPLERLRQRALEKRKQLGALADHVPRVELLKEHFNAYKRALEQRRTHMVDVDRLVDRLAEAARRAGVEPTVNTDALRLEARKEARVRKLLEDRSMLSDRTEYLRAEILRSERELAHHEDVVRSSSGAGPASAQVDASRLHAALTSARALGEVELRIATERSRHERRHKELEARAVGLGQLPEGFESLDAFAALPLPGVASVERLQERADAIDHRIGRLLERIADLEKEAASIEKQRASMAGDFAPPDVTDLRTARGSRDEAWKQLLLTKDDQPGARRVMELEVERWLRESDTLADRMIREADRVTTLARLRSEAEANAKQMEKVLADKSRTLDDRKALDRELALLFHDAKVKPLGFTEMCQWLDKHAQIADAYKTLREAQSDIVDEEAKVDAAKEALAAALTGESVVQREADAVEPHADDDDDDASAEPDPDRALESESPLLAYARARQQQIKTPASSASPRRVDVVAKPKTKSTAKTKSAKTRKKPPPTLRARAFKLTDLIATATSRLAEIDTGRIATEEARRNIVKVRVELTDRAAAKERDEAALVEVNAKLSEILGPIGVPADASVEEVNRSIEALKELFNVARDRAETEARVRVGDAEVSDFEESLSRMVTEFAPDLASLMPRDAATEIFERGRLARVNAQEIETLDARLEEVGGDPAAEEEERAIVMDPDPDFLARAESELDLEIEEVGGAIARLDQKIWGAQRGLDEMRADSNAAEAASQAQEALARLRENVERWARLKLAWVLLSREIERYREENQAPLLASSSTLFSRLTLGAFTGIKAGFDDKDKPCLLCVRADGTTEVDVTGLSDGTRDQLYLSLRLASLLRRADAVEPMPLILDDVLIQLDDQRASAALTVLSEVAGKMQVLFFTHHARLVDLARQAVPSSDLVIHELASTSSSADATASAST